LNAPKTLIAKLDEPLFLDSNRTPCNKYGAIHRRVCIGRKPLQRKKLCAAATGSIRIVQPPVNVKTTVAAFSLPTPHVAAHAFNLLGLGGVRFYNPRRRRRSTAND
jgi:hypothetical protein